MFFHRNQDTFGNASSNSISPMPVGNLINISETGSKLSAMQNMQKGRITCSEVLLAPYCIHYHRQEDEIY